MSTLSWEKGILRDLGAPQTPLNVQKLDAWEVAEGGLSPEGINNPFNTTQDRNLFPGYAYAPAIPVYPSLAVGVEETATTLTQSPASYGYGPIISNLRSGGTLAAFESAVLSSQWGTHSFPSSTGGAPSGNVPSSGTAPITTGPGLNNTSGATTGNSLAGASQAVFGGISSDLSGSIEEAFLRFGELVLALILGYVALRALNRYFSAARGATGPVINVLAAPGRTAYGIGQNAGAANAASGAATSNMTFAVTGIAQ